MKQSNWYLFESETLKIWLHPDSGSFHLHSIEDEWDDWPYPHKMEYYLKGLLKGIGNVNSLASLIHVCPLHFCQDQISSFVYRTLVEDDLYYAQCEEIFHILWDATSTDSLVEIIKQSETGGPYGVLNSSASYKCLVSKPFNGTIQVIENQVQVTWPRFYKKWEKTSDGSEINLGLFPFTSILLKENKTKEPPTSIRWHLE